MRKILKPLISQSLVNELVNYLKARNDKILGY